MKFNEEECASIEINKLTKMILESPNQDTNVSEAQRKLEAECTAREMYSEGLSYKD